MKHSKIFKKKAILLAALPAGGIAIWLFAFHARPEIPEIVSAEHAAPELDEVPFRPRGRNIIHPEEEGPDFTKLPVDDLVAKLGQGDEVEQRKASLVLGDRHIAGYAIEDKEANAIYKAVIGYLDKTASSPAAYMEAMNNINRLWRAAIPALLDCVDDVDHPQRAEMAAECLAAMRNDHILRELARKYRNAPTDRHKNLLRFALSYMELPPHKSMIEGREPITPEEAQRLYKLIIEPELRM